MSTRKSASALLGLSLVMALISLWVASPAGAAPSAIVGRDTGGNVIVIRAQDANNGQVVVDSVSASQDGWLLIRKDAYGAPGKVIGFAPVHQGLNTDVHVDIRTTDASGNDNVTPTLWATLAADPNALNAFASPDATIEQEGSITIVGFGSTAASGTPQAVAYASQVPTTGGAGSSSSAANANKIAVRAQDTNNGDVIVDSVSANQDGWLLIRKDANGAPGNVIGFAPVHQGLNTDVRVDIQITDASGDDNVTSTLWATLVADPNALNAFASPDATIEQEGSIAMVGFGSTAASGAPQAMASASQVPTTGGAGNSSSAANANKIAVRAQDTNNGDVIVDSVSASQDGWLLIRKDANGVPGNVIGFASVHQGLNTDVRVDIQHTDANGNDNLTPTLWATLVADPNAMVAFQSPSSDIQQAGALVQVAFGSAPAGGSGR
jgi:hypothetical protein